MDIPVISPILINVSCNNQISNILYLNIILYNCTFLSIPWFTLFLSRKEIHFCSPIAVSPLSRLTWLSSVVIITNKYMFIIANMHMDTSVTIHVITILKWNERYSHLRHSRSSLCTHHLILFISSCLTTWPQLNNATETIFPHLLVRMYPVYDYVNNLSTKWSHGSY